MPKTVQASQKVLIGQGAEPSEGLYPMPGNPNPTQSTYHSYPDKTSTVVEGIAEAFSRTTISTYPTLSSLSAIFPSSDTHPEDQRAVAHVPPPPNAKPLKGILKEPTVQFPLFTVISSSESLGANLLYPEDVSCQGGRQKSRPSHKALQPYSRGASDSLLRCHHKSALRNQPPRPAFSPYPTTTRDPRRRPVLPSLPVHHSHASCSPACASMSNNLAAKGEGTTSPQDMSDLDGYLPDYEDEESTCNVTNRPPGDAEGDCDIYAQQAGDADDEEDNEAEHDGDADHLSNIMNTEEEKHQLLYDIFYASDSDDEDDGKLDAGPSEGPSMRAALKGKMIDPRERGGQHLSFSDSDSNLHHDNGYNTDGNVMLAQQSANPSLNATIVTEEDVDHFLQDTIEATYPPFSLGLSSSESPSLSSSMSSTSTSAHFPATPPSSPPPPPPPSHSLGPVQQYKDTEATTVEQKPSWLSSSHIASLELLDIEMEIMEVTLDDDAMDTTEDFPSGQSFLYPAMCSSTIGASPNILDDAMDVDLDTFGW